MQPCPLLENEYVSFTSSSEHRVAQTYERTNLSLLSHLGFLGLNLMNLLKRTWAMGAMPLGKVSSRSYPASAAKPEV